MSRSTESEPCPVCYADMKCQRDYMDGWALEEATEDCPNGCWWYHYAYGSSEINVTIRGHHITYGWGYGEDTHEVSATIKLLCDSARKVLIEDLLKDKARIDWLEKDPFENWEAVDFRLRNWNDTVRQGLDRGRLDTDASSGG